MLYRTGLGPVFGLRREIDKLFEDTFGGSRDGGTGWSGSSWSPAVDVCETNNDLRIDFEVPGINPEDVEITTDNGVLTVKGQRRTERKEQDENKWHVVERSYGSFTRSFQLPQGLDDEKIEAEYNNGILSVKIPKSALPQPRRIQINKGTSASQGQVRGSQSERTREISSGGRGDQSSTEMNSSQTNKSRSNTRNTRETADATA